MGRWSRRVAAEFLTWLGVPEGGDWLDVGCGTGALSETILAQADPRLLRGLDASADYVASARRRVSDSRVSFAVGDARALAEPARRYDAVVSGLMLNFVPNVAAAVTEMARVARPGATVAAYLWDYAGEMQLMRYFWDAAAELDPAARALDEGQRFPMCRPEPLAELWRGAGLEAVRTRAIDVATVFRDFDDYWMPFLGGQGPAPGYAMSLDQTSRGALRDLIRSRLPAHPDGTIHLVARAWAVTGAVSRP